MLFRAGSRARRVCALAPGRRVSRLPSRIPRDVEAESDELVEAPDTRPVRGVGLIELAR